MFALAIANDANTDLVVLQFTYTTADITRSNFSGESPDPYYFAMPEPPTDIAPTTLIVIDGEARVLRDEVLPGAILPDPDAGPFKLIEHAD